MKNLDAWHVDVFVSYLVGLHNHVELLLLLCYFRRVVQTRNAWRGWGFRFSGICGYRRFDGTCCLYLHEPGLAVDLAGRPEYLVISQWVPQTLHCECLFSHFCRRCLPCVRVRVQQAGFLSLTIVLITLFSDSRQHLSFALGWALKRLLGSRRFPAVRTKEWPFVNDVLWESVWLVLVT